MVSKWCCGNRADIQNSFAWQSLLLLNGELQTKVWEQPHRVRNLLGFVSLRLRFPPLAPHRLRTTETIFPEGRLSFYWSMGTMRNTCCKLLSGVFILTVFPTPFSSLRMSRVKSVELACQIVLMGKGNPEGERTKDWQWATIFWNLIRKPGACVYI